MGKYSLLVVVGLTLGFVCDGELALHVDEHCDQCQSNDIVQFPFMISPQDFYSSFVSKHKPVVFKGAAFNWPTFQLWTDNHIMARYRNGETIIRVKKSQVHSVQSPYMKMSAKEFFLKYSTEGLQIDDELTGKAFLQDITAPLCLCCEKMIDKVNTFYSLSSANTTLPSNLHLISQETLLVVLNGNIQVLLLSPINAEKLFADESLFVGVTEIKVTRKHLEENKVPFQMAELQEGDMLYMPQMWWQQTLLQPGRNLAIRFQWPASFPLTLTKETKKLKSHEDLISKGKFTILSKMLMKYEHILQTSQQLPLKCVMQDKRMSEFEFETTKMSPEDYEKIHNGPDYSEKFSCNFDESNLKSPCNAKVCLKDLESEACIKYSLEYCMRWEDHGCITDMPQILNKKTHKEFHSILALESQYESDS